jgi:3-hydroxyisobutyrate dehydrogenase-like beta-hydroxyacid dehydrogenase
MSRDVGFVGIGMMGAPMSRNLFKAGFNLVVWNRTENKTSAIVEAGARAAPSACAVAESSDVIVMMLTGPRETEDVMHAPDGILAGLRQGATVIDMSTNAPEVSRRLATKVAERGGVMLDAPVSGSIGLAAAGALTIQIGGDRAAFEAQRDIFAALGKNIFHVGGNGMGCVVKLVGNAIMATNMAVLAEALCLGAKAGAQTDTMIEVLKVTTAASAVLDRRQKNLLSGDFGPQFKLNLLHKDLGLALDAAAAGPVAMPVTGLIRQIYAQAMTEGYGDLDFAAVAASAEAHAAVKLAMTEGADREA